jgi:hypothetical protein
MEEGHEAAAVAYRYRKFELSGGISLVARTTIHAGTEGSESGLAEGWT